ncbi:MAG TPA: O-antigen ligase family protein [Solirubrobacteraceae bacterium]
MSIVATRSSLRTVIALLAAAAAILAATGVVQIEAFQQPSSLKYGLTIAAPLIALLACTMEHPLRLITGLTIVAAPFVGATASLASTRVSVLVPLLIAGAGLAIISAPAGAGRLSSVGVAGVLAFPLLLLPLAIGSSNHSFIVTLGLLLAVAWLVSQTAQEPGGMKAVLVAVAMSAALQSAIAIWEVRTGHQLNLYGANGNTQLSAANYVFYYGKTLRPFGSFNNPIALGDVLAIFLPLICALGLTARARSHRIVLLATALLAGAGIALALSRAGWIGALGGLTATVLLLPRGLRRRVTPVLLGGAALIVVVALVVAGPAVRGRFASIANPTAVHGVSAAQQGPALGDQDLLQYWHVAIDDAFLGHPIAGIGIDNLGDYLRDRVARSGAGISAGDAQYLSANSTYFQILAEGGLFALALFLLLFRGLYRDLREGLRAFPILGAGLAGGVVALLICWTTDYTIQNEPVAACMAILLGAVAAAGRSGSRIRRAPVG